MQPKKRIIIVTGMLLAMIFWAYSFIWYKQVFVAYPPVTVVFLRLLISSAILMLFSWFTGKLSGIRQKDIKSLLLLSFFNPFIYFIGESIGVSLVSSSVSAVIVSTIPLFTPIASRYYFGEKLTRINLFGIMVSFLGILVIVFRNGWEMNISLTGLGFLLIAVFSAVFYTVILKNLSDSIHPITIISIQNVIGTVYFIPVVFIIDRGTFLHTPLNPDVLWPLVKLAIFGSSLAFIFYTYGVKELGAARANIYTNLIPVITVVLAAIILKESITPMLVLGIFIVVTGVLLSQLSQMRKKKRGLILPGT